MKDVIRAYPGDVTFEEKMAVELAIKQIQALPDGYDRLRFIELVFWKRHTVAGAAIKIPCSERTAQRWHADFIRRVAKNFICENGLY